MSFTRQELRAAARSGVLVGLWIGAAALATYVAVYYARTGHLGADAHAYWRAGRSDHPYDLPPRYVDAFEYSPVFLQLVRPLAVAPFAVFFTLWAGVQALAFGWMTSGLAWRWRVPVLLMCGPELCLGNLNAFFGLVLVLGLRRPELWAFPLLTKLTPAGVGLVWFLARGEVTALLRCAGTVLVVTAASYAAEPRLWHEWVGFLHGHGADHSIGIAVRVLLALGLAAVLARRDLRWPLPAVFLLATPVFGFNTNQTLAMVPPSLALRRQGAEGDARG